MSSTRVLELPMDRYMRWTALVILTCMAGCVGNGDGLNQNGDPITAGGNPSEAITADFQSIQDNVFTPICTKCHIGASAPEGLQLDSAHSYNLLVGIPSNEQPNLLRVKPSDPNDSYLVQKIEGAPGIDGGQMPLGETPLPQATIDAIRQWITNGAPNVAAASAAAAFSVQGTAPVDKAIVKSPPARIVVTFTQDLDASLVNETTITLERIGSPVTGSNAPQVGSEAPVVGSEAPAVGSEARQATRTIAAVRRLAQSNAAALLITPNTPLQPGTYRVTLRGTGGGALANMNATTLGLNMSFEFTVAAE